MVILDCVMRAAGRSSEAVNVGPPLYSSGYVERFDPVKRFPRKTFPAEPGKKFGVVRFLFDRWRQRRSAEVLRPFRSSATWSANALWLGLRQKLITWMGSAYS